ncbi:MAG: GAF domain-containing protein, partial [Planctomycetaceae bacterium]
MSASPIASTGDDPAGEALLRQRLRGSMTLVDVTVNLAALHELEDILQTVTERVCDALFCERASLYLYDENKHELYTRVVTELEIEEIRSAIDSGITGWVARTRKIANVPDPHVDARWNSAIDRKTGFKTRNILAAPIVSTHDERLLGVLQLLNRIDGR